MLTAVTMVRDEADILPLTIRALWDGGVDLIIAADNLSTDGSGDLLRDLGCQVHEYREPGYFQAEKMTRLAHLAWERGARWVIPFDADEVWRGDGCRLRQVLPAPGDDVIYVRPHVMRPNSNGWVRDYHAEPYPKVSFRAHPDARLHMGNHGVDHPGDRGWWAPGIEVDHYQYRSLEQVRRKVRQGTEAYDATGYGGEYGTHWRALAALTDEQLEQWWRQYQAG